MMYSSNLPLPGNTGGIFSGDLTYYAPGLGACGVTSTDTDMICAISHIVFGTSPAQTLLLSPNTTNKMLIVV